MGRWHEWVRCHIHLPASPHSPSDRCVSVVEGRGPGDSESGDSTKLQGNEETTCDRQSAEVGMEGDSAAITLGAHGLSLYRVVDTAMTNRLRRVVEVCEIGVAQEEPVEARVLHSNNDSGSSRGAIIDEEFQVLHGRARDMCTRKETRVSCKLYAVRRGRRTGIFCMWEDCRE
ncbi:hypothetical protein KC19_VG023700 [Ceratodon purpureus]|uniref:Ribonuclease H1 N-terminal domain-containing protein n=1 Tax=Ceratodon purpureus TaxID=3225 RepID=A0A8T0HL93_CERPU|nr:hypothetical protein KC19_VG023700 [Ceratodon purpureus]